MVVDDAVEGLSRSWTPTDTATPNSNTGEASSCGLKSQLRHHISFGAGATEAPRHDKDVMTSAVA